MIFDMMKKAITVNSETERRFDNPDEILASYKVDPEKEKEFGKQVCQSLRGKVTVGLGTVVMLVVHFALVIAILCAMFRGASGWLLMLFLVPALMAGAVYIWYLLSWELTFDGETGYLSFRSLFRQEIRFHVSDIDAFNVESPSLLGLFTLENQAVLIIHVWRQLIRVPLGAYTVKGGVYFQGGYVNANKLKEYLEMYRRYLEPDARELVADGISPGVAAAIARQNALAAEEAARERAMLGKVSLRKTGHGRVPLKKEETPYKKARPGKVSLSKDAPEPAAPVLPKPTAPVLPKPVNYLSEKPVNYLSEQPERSASAFPDPTNYLSEKRENSASAFPDPTSYLSGKPENFPAAEPTPKPEPAPETVTLSKEEPEPKAPAAPKKSDVDIDALFNSVVKQYEKEEDKYKPRRSRKRK